MKLVFAVTEPEAYALDVAAEADRSTSWHHVKREQFVAFKTVDRTHQPLCGSLPLPRDVVRPQWDALEGQIFVFHELLEP